jgi:transposase
MPKQLPYARREAVRASIVAGEDIQEIASRYNTTYSTVWRHKRSFDMENELGFSLKLPAGRPRALNPGLQAVSDPETEPL